MNQTQHDALMAMALALGRRGQGGVAPNPAVGCIIVAPDGRIVGRGWTQPGGRPHAETMALAQAGQAATGATAYVTLEPCSHHGQTPPCAEALIAAGIGRVVVACSDPDLRVNGRGLAMLRAAGIEVLTGVGMTQAMDDLSGFLSKVQQQRPLFSLKLATGLDGRIALGNGVSQWITGAPARAAGQALRARHDGILIGSGTALADDPTLTCRLPGLGDASPVRIVLDSHLRLSPDSRLARSIDQAPLWLVTTPESAGTGTAARWQGLGAVLLPVAGMATPAIAAALAAEGMTRVLIEGGRQVATSFLATGLVDRLEWFRAPCIMGGDALPALGDLGLTDLEKRYNFRLVTVRPLGNDLWERYVRETGA